MANTAKFKVTRNGKLVSDGHGEQEAKREARRLRGGQKETGVRVEKDGRG